MKNILLFAISLLFVVKVFPQNDKSKNPSVELPDFVITGTENITVKKTQKIAPAFVPIISEAFIKPYLPPDNLEVKDFSNPVKGSLDILDSLNFYRGYADISAGRYLLPQGDLGLAFPFRYGMVDGYVKGENQRAYVINSDRYSLDGGANVLLSVNSNSDFLPGTQFKFHGDYGSSVYKFFASDSSGLKRTLNSGSFSFGMNNFISDNFNFSAKLYDDVTSLNKEDFSEGLFGVEGFTKAIFDHFNIDLNAAYKRQYVASMRKSDSLWFSSNGGSYKFFEIKPAVGFNISNTIKTSVGVYYSKSGNTNFIAPYGAIGLRLNRGVLIFAEYNPQMEFLTSGNFLKQNDYFLAANHVNIVYKKKNAINAAIKYEYGEYYQINAGFKFFNFKNLPYFLESSAKGKFDITWTNGKSFDAFIDLLFHLGPYGIFYASMDGSDVRDLNNHFIPYYPRILAALAYGYEFNSGFGTKVKINYNSKSYADIQNTIDLNSYFDLGLKFSYKFNPNFNITLSLNNLFDHKNYKWIGYREKPLDVAAGLEFKW